MPKYRYTSRRDTQHIMACNSTRSLIRLYGRHEVLSRLSTVERRHNLTRSMATNHCHVSEIWGTIVITIQLMSHQGSRRGPTPIIKHTPPCPFTITSECNCRYTAASSNAVNPAPKCRRSINLISCVRRVQTNYLHVMYIPIEYMNIILCIKTMLKL